MSELVYSLIIGSVVLIPPMIQLPPPAPTEAFQFLTEEAEDQWTPCSPIWMISNLRDEDRALVVLGLIIRRRIVSCQSHAKLQMTTTTDGRA